MRAADFGVLGEGAEHLVGGLDVELLGVELEALGVVHAAGGLDAEQDFVRAGVVGGDVVGVVGGDQRDVEFVLHLEHRVADGLVRARGRGPESRGRSCLCRRCPGRSLRCLGLVVLPVHHVLGDFAGEAAGEADEAFGVFGEKVF